MANIKSIGGNPIVLDASGIAAGAVTPDKLADIGGITAGAALGITGGGGTAAAWLQRVSTSDGPTTVRSIHGNTIVQDGELVPVNMVGIESTGFNQWDEQWENGLISGGGLDNSIHSKNFCRIFPNTTYYATCGKTDGGSQNKYYLRVVFYDANKTLISAGYYNNLTFTTPENAAYFKLETNTSTVIYGNTYNNDICINLSDPTRNGTYVPYWQSERTIPAGTLRGAGSVYDEQTATERIVRVGERAYQSGDESDATVVTDGTITYYPLATPTVTTYDPPLNMTYRTGQGGTERVMVPTGEQSAPPTLITAQGYTAESLRDAALSAIAPVENGTASTNYGIGSYLVHGGQLCRVTTAIATGEAISIGTNVTATTVMAEVIALIAQ